MSRGYVLKGASIVTTEGSYDADIRLSRDRIREIGLTLPPNGKEIELDCTGHVIYPGLINSHDHLAFDLFPRLGEPPYSNAYEWGQDLHGRWRTTIESITRIPLRYRLYWGAWRNLFTGVTRVVHHDIYSSYFRFAFPVDVLRKYTYANSLRSDPNLQQALHRRKKGVPFLIHLAEGTDELSAGEVTSLKNLGGLDDRTVAVHAVGISDNDIRLLTEARSSVVWCPSSNIFLFGKTAPVRSFSGKICMALGTDSTLTGTGTLFEELRTARRESIMSPRELFALVTDSPRTIFQLPSDAGTIRENGHADLFLLPATSGDPYETLLAANPGDINLLLKGGRVVLFDPSFFPHLINRSGGSPVRFDGKVKFVRDHRFIRLHKELKPFVRHYTYMNSE